MKLEDLVALETGLMKMTEMPKDFWVATLYSDTFCAPFPLPHYKKDDVEFKPMVSNKPDGLICILQNHEFPKLLQVKMVTSKKYTASFKGQVAYVQVERVADHLKRLEAFAKEFKSNE